MSEINEIKICGLQKTTLLDYPGIIAATIFLGGCNLRCPFCHNADLLENHAPAQYAKEEILQFLSRRKTILEGVCITGGEPTLQPVALECLIRDIRALGLRIKLDTNGTRPKVIKSLASKGLLDYVAMDIKSSPDSYHTASGISRSDLEAVKESVLWLKHGTLPYEFRTTAVKGLHHRNDFEQIGHWIDGCSHYYLQNYTASDRVLHPYGFDSFSREELLEFADIVRPYAGKVSLRGVDY